jgi:dsRNA-specific ribonuclease
MDNSNMFKNGEFMNHILNEKNVEISVEFIESIFKKYGLDHKVKILSNFEQAMVHISYLNRTSITDKTSKILRDVIPISDDMKPYAIPLKEKDYNRLEFLGDSMIHCILAKYLYNRYENEDQGFLTQLRTKLEKDEALSKLSKILGLHKYAIIARNIEQMDGRMQNIHLTEDIFEAFIGALSLEISFDKLEQFVLTIMENEMDMAELINSNDNYKTRLMQYFHKMKWSDPKYHEDNSDKEQNNYTIFVNSQNGEVLGYGKGITKLKAEQNCAYNCLINVGEIDENEDLDNDNDFYGVLSDTCSENDSEHSDDNDDSEHSDVDDVSENSDYYEIISESD